MLRDFERLGREGIKVGMSWDETVQLVLDGAREMRQTMAREGLVKKVPWGTSCDPRSVILTLSKGFMMLLDSAAELDEGELDELPADPAKFYATYVNGALTTAAAALLYLHSAPISYELSRHMIAIPEPTEVSDARD